MSPNALEIALEFIKQWEGCRLKAYTDQGGRITIGWGHTGNVQLGEAWSQDQADEQLQYDVNQVAPRTSELIKVPVNDNQTAALLSFCYNLGVGNLKRSGLLKLLNQYKYAEAADQFPLWCNVGMYKSPGLLARRDAEKALFLKEPDVV